LFLSDGNGFAFEADGATPGEGHVIVTGISTRNCVQSAVMGFGVRDYHIYVPMDCTAHNDEKQVLQAFSLFTSFGYKHNVTMTRSDLIQLY
jgi:nicotinamidase-related amidase